jgi:hypothetical protein
MEGRAQKFWVARFMPDNSRDFFRVFTKWGTLLTSLGRPKLQLHPSWSQTNFTIYYVDTTSMEVRDVTQVAVQTAMEYSPTPEEREADEPATWPHF